MTDTIEERLELSINEANALRARLGLKPLRVTTTDNSTKQPVLVKDGSRKSDSDNDDDDDDDDVFMNGETLGTTISTDENALSWAQKMRDVSGVSAALKAAKVKKNLNSRNAVGDRDAEQDLAGMTVAAGLGEIGSEEMVLTLKDESILDVNENHKNSGVVEGKDQLENLTITEKYKAKDVMKRKRELAKYKSGYSGMFVRYYITNHISLRGRIYTLLKIFLIVY